MKLVHRTIVLSIKNLSFSPDFFDHLTGTVTVVLVVCPLFRPL